MFRKVLAMVIVISGVAAAAPPVSNSRATAQIAWAHGAKSRLVADDRVWRCVNERCDGQVFDRPNSRLRTCRQLARTGGQVMSFKVAGAEIAPSELERCNRGLTSGKRS